MPRVWKIMLALALVLSAARVARAQSPVAVVDGEVVNGAGQPASNTLVVVFMNSHEVGRGETVCTSGACRFEIAIPNESGLGSPGPDGVSRVHAGTITVKTPKLLETTGTATPHRGVYAVLALSEAADAMPPEMKDGQLGLMPDGGVAVINPTRPVDTPLPTGAATFSISNSLTALAALAIMGVVCVTSLVIIAGAVVWLAYRWRRSTAPESSP